MRVFREPEPDLGREALTLALGAAGGLAIGLLMARRNMAQPVGGLGTELRERARQAGEKARTAVRRMEPARLKRMIGEVTELTELEDAVLNSFFGDAVLSERSVDVGAISQGIIELSGSVWTRDEAARAVRLANAVPGVRTVVNRLLTDEDSRAGAGSRLRAVSDAESRPLREMGRTGGMGTRRQSPLTDPDRSDDSQDREERALRQADKDQWMDEGYAAVNPRTSERGEDREPGSTRYSEDELDNQDPHGKHRADTRDRQPQEFNSDARVGEGAKPGIEMNIEQSGLRAESGSSDESADRG